MPIPLSYLLSRQRLFADLDLRELEALAGVSARREYRKKQILFHEGDLSGGFFLVLSGAVKVFRSGPDGRERLLHVVEAGEAFAEAALFMETYPATAQALSHCAVIFVEKNGFKQLLARSPRLSLKVILTMTRWLRQMRDALTDLTLKEVPARFASYVLSLPLENDRALTVTISKTTQAQILGTTKETLSRLLQRLARHKVLTYRGHQIHILNRSRLERIARGEEKI